MSRWADADADADADAKHTSRWANEKRKWQIFFMVDNKIIGLGVISKKNYGIIKEFFPNEQMNWCWWDADADADACAADTDADAKGSHKKTVFFYF